QILPAPAVLAETVEDDEPSRDEGQHRAPAKPPERVVQQPAADDSAADGRIVSDKLAPEERRLHEVEVVQHPDPGDAGQEMPPPQEKLHALPAEQVHRLRSSSLGDALLFLFLLVV